MNTLDGENRVSNLEERVSKLEAKLSDGVALQAQVHPRDSYIGLEMELESALIDVLNATDGSGKKIILYQPPKGKTYTVQSLKDTLFVLMKNVGSSTIFLSSLTQSSAQGEIAYWRNLSLLAHATAVAIEFEARKNGD